MQTTLRIIPTRMGTSNLSFGKESVKKDHPHAYGDKVSVALPSVSAVGSSPRVWGQVVVSLFGMPSCGIIPTRMGTRYSRYLSILSGEDHPHAYGDKIFLMCLLMQVIGSSPRVWGQEQNVWFRYMVSRIIPTRMGTRAGKILLCTV